LWRWLDDPFGVPIREPDTVQLTLALWNLGQHFQRPQPPQPVQQPENARKSARHPVQ